MRAVTRLTSVMAASALMVGTLAVPALADEDNDSPPVVVVEYRARRHQRQPD